MSGMPDPSVASPDAPACPAALLRPPLTDDEREALRLSGQLANLVRRIIGSGPCAEDDWAEAAQRIHGIQHMVMAQAAARAYPDEFRLLGGEL